MAAMRSGVILLLLAAAPAALASTQAAQNVQGQQNSQMFGIPPLPVILGAAGAALKQINSPITLNTRVVQDPVPAQQQQVYYGQAAAADDDTTPQQQYVSSSDSDETVATTIAQPSTGGQADAGSGYWIQNADGSRTPLSDNDPILLQLPAAANGHIVSGSIVDSTLVPVTTPPASQQVSWTVSSSQSLTGMTSNAPTAVDVTYDDSNTVVAMPVYQQPRQQQQQQQQQVWVGSKGPQVVQGSHYNYPTRTKDVQMVVVKQPGGMAVGYGTVGYGNTGPIRAGAGMQPGQGMAWGAAGAAEPVRGGNMGQMQGPMGGQGAGWGMGQGQGMQGPMGGQGAGWGMGQGQGMQGPMGGQGAGWGMGQGQMQGPANQQGNMGTWSSGSADSSADANFVQQQQQQQQQQQGAFGGQPPMVAGMVSEDPTAGTVIDNSNNQQGSNVGGSVPGRQAAPGWSAPMPTAPVAGSAGPGPAVGSGARTLLPGLGTGGPLSRRAPAMIPLNPTEGTLDGGMGDAPDN